MSLFQLSFFAFITVASFIAGAIYGRKLASRAERDARELKAAAEEGRIRNSKFKIQNSKSR